MATVELKEVTLDPFVVPTEPVKRWTVSEYHDLIKAGILVEDAPFELIEGWLVPKMTRNPPHDVALSLLTKWISNILPPQWECRSQMPITLSDGEPEPDLAIVLGPLTRYVANHPYPADVGIVIEVSDRSLVRDRGIKLRSYARAGIREYWIVNMVDGFVEVYSLPSGPDGKPSGYAKQQILGPGEFVPLTISGQTYAQFAVADILV